MNVIVVKTNDTYEIVNINNDYKELQNIVGGLIEPVHPTIAYQTEMLLPGTLFIVDEEGLLKEKALNKFGTLLYNGNTLNYYPIVVGYKNVDRLKAKLREYGAVFMKTEEVLDLPEQLDNVIKVESTKEYKKFVKNRLIEIDGKELVGDTSLTKMLYQRQLASQYNSNKTTMLRDLLESTNDRVIIFYNFNEELEKIENVCNKLERPVSVVNGSKKDLKAYDKEETSVTCIQYQAGAMGLNLQKANKIIYFSLPLSSELFEQSKKRIHRIGQKKSCFYYYLITEKSIEEKIYEVLGQRRDFTNKLFEEMED